MKKTLVFTLMACLAIATASYGQYTSTIDFEAIPTGTPVTGLGAVSDLLIISGTNLQVVEEGQPSGLLAYNSLGAPDGRNWLPGDNTKSFGNDAFADQSPTAENLRIDFNPAIVVTSFEIQMFDYGDWFPLGGSNPREATLKAYDSSDVELDSLTLSKTLQNPGNDVTLGGVDTLSVSGDDIAYVELTFADVDPGISYDNITIEYCQWVDETAWADGDLYNEDGKGNWATYVEYEEGTVDLLAGQNIVAGTVGFSAVDEGEVTITIILNEGWRFADVEENVKIQGYSDAPSGNPKPGQFADKGDADPGESTFEITVLVNNFYGVHVDVEWLDCGEE